MNNCLAFNTIVTTWKDFQNSFGSSIVAQYSLFGNEMIGYSSGPGNLTTTASPFVSTTDLQLASSSLAINVGNPASSTVLTGPYSISAVPATDLASQARIIGERIDIGAYEYQPTANVAVRSVRDGLWNDSATWSCGCIPESGQRVTISHTVTIPVAYQASCLSVEYGTSGRIVLATSSVLRLSQ